VSHTCGDFLAKIDDAAIKINAASSAIRAQKFVRVMAVIKDFAVAAA
jgi:hypothetical protein